MQRYFVTSVETMVIVAQCRSLIIINYKVIAPSTQIGISISLCNKKKQTNLITKQMAHFFEEKTYSRIILSYNKYGRLPWLLNQRFEMTNSNTSKVKRTIKNR